MDAKQHIVFLEETLKRYSKSLENVGVLIGDNCATNKRVSKDTGIPFIGCASHQFNLAVNNWIKEQSHFDTVLEQIHNVMVQLCKLKHAARLRKLNSLCAIKDNVTR